MEGCYLFEAWEIIGRVGILLVNIFWRNKKSEVLKWNIVVVLYGVYYLSQKKKRYLVLHHNLWVSHRWVVGSNIHRDVSKPARLRDWSCGEAFTVRWCCLFSTQWDTVMKRCWWKFFYSLSCNLVGSSNKYNRRWTRITWIKAETCRNQICKADLAKSSQQRLNSTRYGAQINP